MAKLPEPKDPTLEAVDEMMALTMNEAPRGHLGASMIGDPCHRKLWYGFRWVVFPSFSADTLALFDDGHRSEDIMAARLRLVDGIELHTETPEGKQYGFKDCGGHLAGSTDGLIRGLLQAPKKPHIWEHKCCNEKKFAQLEKLKIEHGEKGALAEWDPIYYAQAQVYMHYFKTDRHYLTVATPGTRRVTSCRTEYHAGHALAMVSKAEQIIASSEPPTRLTERKDDFRCKFCSYQEQCHYNGLASEHCRTCQFAQPVDGGWHCRQRNELLDIETQRIGCAEFRPAAGLNTLTEDAA